MLGFVWMPSCSSKKVLTENQLLHQRVKDLEYKVYVLSESPQRYMDDMFQDVDLLMSLASKESLYKALFLMQDFEDKYPATSKNKAFKQKKAAVQDLMLVVAKRSKALAYSWTGSSFGKDNYIEKPAQLEFSVHIKPKTNGFVSVEVSVRNRGQEMLGSIWLKASILQADKETYGLTQDFFFKTLLPNALSTEVLSWEYITMDNIQAVKLFQIMLNQNKRDRLVNIEECFIVPGNVKVFIEN
ncbi:MAG: hypothetical protein B7C24_08000 [Bacteroidetes bacterium 4572_77]|nr:MAG: hypothetical protein B7C24_08000 [Bacteroidetes bacterium 4572_77]